MIEAGQHRELALERALLWNFLVHGVAMLAMALLLLPMMPGGNGAPAAERALAIAAHPWLFRLGWLPWQLCALADLWLAIALLRAPSVPRAPSLLCLALTVAAVAPDQYAQAVWITRGVALARDAGTAEGLAAYLAFEGPTFTLTAGWGALGYTLGGLAWTACLRGAGIWCRALALLSWPLWLVMLAVSLGALLLPPSSAASAALAAGNALGFALLLLWLGLATELALRRSRPTESFGRWAPVVPPGPGLGRLAAAVMESRLLRELLSLAPVLPMRSDISEVVYVNYLVPAERLLPLVPPGLELQRLGPDGQWALFTFLSYRHGAFGFSWLGPLRRLCPSPLQSNWRIHVRDPRSGLLGISFLTIAITSTFYAVMARLLSEGMPMHPLRDGSIERDADGALHLRLDPGGGSAPDAEASLRPTQTPALPEPFATCFADFAAFLAYCVPQDRAFSSQPWERRLTAQEIELGIPLEACEPLDGAVTSRAAEALAGEAAPLCFRVPAVPFRFLRQWRRPLP